LEVKILIVSVNFLTFKNKNIFYLVQCKGKGTKAGESRPSPFSLAFSRSVALLPYFFEDF
jgi:hypothetical protein